MKLTDRIDTLSVRLFQNFAGESLENLDEFEVYDIITVLPQALAAARMCNAASIMTNSLAECMSLEISDDARRCLKALNGFPTTQVPLFIQTLLTVAFEEG